ncbi:MAG: hypothetical protein JNG89_19635 [Planctomycetaceae bacterium]|nr:hypothetical protein [Planctomycetaceae bacterium]
MTGFQLTRLVAAGWLMFGIAGCRTCLLAPLSHLRSERDTCTVAPPSPQASSDQHRPTEPAASPSPESPESSSYLENEAPAGSSAPAAESGEAARLADQQTADSLKKLGGRVSIDSQGIINAVDLAQTAITDGDLELLAGCPGLVELNVRGTLVSDAGLKTIASLHNLEFLGLTGTMVTDEGMSHLQQLSNLRFLTLGHTAVTDTGIQSLAGCARLEGLNVKGTPVSAAGLVQLQAQLPQCRIVSDVTSTTSIDSEDLPLPMLEESETSVSPSQSPDASGERTQFSTDPFAPLPPAALPVAPPASEPPQEIPGPEASRRSARRMPQARVESGPARRLDRVLNDSLSDPSVLRAIAQSYADRKEWDAAAAVLREAAEHNPGDRDLQFELGVAEARSGDFVAALMHLQQCSDLAVAHYNLGILLHEAGLEDASILAFRSALKYEPGLSQARVWLEMLSPGQATAAGKRPAMIGAPVVTPVEAQSSEEASAQQAGGGVEIRPAGARRVIKRR